MQIYFFPNSADKDAQKGKKSARKTTRAGGSGVDLMKVAQEQQAKLEKQREEIKEQIKVVKEAAAAAPPPAPAPATKDVQPSKNASVQVRFEFTNKEAILARLIANPNS